MSDPEQYRRLIWKLNYLTVTRPDISFSGSVVSQLFTLRAKIIGMQSFVF